MVLLAVPCVAYGQVAKIAFHTNRDGNAEVYTMDVAGTMQVNLTNNPAADEYPVICGSKVVYSSDRDAPGNPTTPGHFDIWVQNIDGSGTPINLTPNTPGSNDHEPSCSSTIYASNRIVFRSDRDGNDENYRMKSNGTELVRLTYNNYSDEQPQWCGNQIIFIRDLLGIPPCGSVVNENCPNATCPVNPGTDYQLFIMSADGDGFPGGTPPPARALTGGSLHNVDPGPNCIGAIDARLFYWPSCHSDGAGGQDIVFSAYNPATYEGRKIYRIPLCASGLCVQSTTDLPPTLTPNSDLSIQNDYPAWSPGGDFIVFASDVPYQGETGPRDWDVYTMDAVDGSNKVARTTGLEDVDNEDPHWSETKP